MVSLTKSADTIAAGKVSGDRLRALRATPIGSIDVRKPVTR